MIDPEPSQLQTTDSWLYDVLEHDQDEEAEEEEESDSCKKCSEPD